MKKLTLDEFQALEASDKIPYLSKDGDGRDIFHLLFAQQFKRPELDAQLVGDSVAPSGRRSARVWG